MYQISGFLIVLITIVNCSISSAQDTINGINLETNYATNLQFQSETKVKLNITVEFDQLSTRKHYDFRGTLIIPLTRIPSMKKYTLRLSKVNFKARTTFQRSVYLKQSILTGIYPQIYVSFEPEYISPLKKYVNIKSISLNEIIKTTISDGTNVKTTITTVHRGFMGFGMDGTIAFKSETKFPQVFDSFKSSESETDVETYFRTSSASSAAIERFYMLTITYILTLSFRLLK